MCGGRQDSPEGLSYAGVTESGGAQPRTLNMVALAHSVGFQAQWPPSRPPSCSHQHYET